jgi:putative transcriptional regulator
MPEQELGNHLKDMRAKHNITQADLAARVGVSRKTINTVENGVFTPSAALALKLARALGAPVEKLFFLRE